MKYWLLLLAITFASVQTGRSQCAPQNPSGNIGFFPATDLLPCVDRGVFYDETFFLENVDSFVFQGFGSIRIDTFRIDSIVNLPCGLNWISDKGDNAYGTGATGCIRVYGVSEDSSGQYELKVYVTIVATILGRLEGEINQIISDLEQITGPLGVDFQYFVRVKEPANNCPNIDRSPNAPTAITAQRGCTFAGLPTVSIIGDTMICRGNTAQLSLTTTNAPGAVVSWQPAAVFANPSSATTDINLATSSYVTVEVTDSAGRVAFDRVWVQLDTASPVASFVDTTNGLNIKLLSTSLNGSIYTWDLGDQTTANGPLVLHTYAAEGVYPISLTVTNSCGSDVYYDTLYIGNVGISQPDADALKYTLLPNPAQGTVYFHVQHAASAETLVLTLFDMAGKQVLQPLTTIAEKGQMLPVDVASLQPGIYTLSVQTSYSNTFKRLVIY